MKRVCVVVTMLFLIALSLGIPTASATSGPINIAILLPRETANGLAAMAAIEMFFEERGLEVAGRPINLFWHDTGVAPGPAVDAFVRAIEQQEAPLVIGPLSGGQGTAVRNQAEFYVDEVTVIMGVAGSVPITLNTPPNVFRVNPSGLQVSIPLGQYAFEELGHRRALIVASDYDFTFAQVAGFLHGFVGAGGEVADRIWFTRGETDYSSVLAAIAARDDFDVIFAGINSTDSLHFMRQFREFGINVPLLGGPNFTDVSNLQSTIGYFYEGVITSSYFADELGTPEYTDFVARFTNHFGLPPGTSAVDFYLAVQIFVDALELVNGEVENKDAFRAAVRNMQFESPRGRFVFDDDNQTVATIFITEVKINANGVAQNIVIQEYPDVTQFGDFCSDWFIAQPFPDHSNPTIEAIRTAVIR